jgi:hypothetical protein
MLVGRLVCGKGEFEDVSGVATKWEHGPIQRVVGYLSNWFS